MTDYERTTTTRDDDHAAGRRRAVRRSGGCPAPVAPASGPPTRPTSRPAPAATTYAARVVTFLFGILQVAAHPADHPAAARRQPRQRHRAVRPQHHPAVRRPVHRDVLAEPRDRRPGLGPRRRRDRRAHRVDPHRGAHPGRDPDLLASDDRRVDRRLGSDADANRRIRFVFRPRGRRQRGDLRRARPAAAAQPRGPEHRTMSRPRPGRSRSPSSATQRRAPASQRSPPFG